MKKLSPSHILNSPASVDKLMTLAARARVRVPFYRERLACVDFSAPDLSLATLPFLEKRDVRASGTTMICPDFSEDRPGAVISFTSGSTGVPLRLVRTKIEIEPSVRAYWRARAAIFPDVLNTTGVVISTSNSSPERHGPKRGPVQLPMAKYTRDDYLDKLISLQPRWLSGPPALLSLLVESMQRSQKRLQTKLAFVESNSDYLGQEMRDRLAAFFECPVVNHYGCEEVLTIAYECPRGNMHLFDSCVVAELLPLPEYNTYEIVVSSLILETMPFLRYRLGDSVRVEEERCTCGNPAPLLGHVQGRTTELIAGTILCGHFFFSHFMHTVLKQTGVNSVLGYQIHQVAMNDFLVQFQLDERVSSQRCEHFQIISAAFREVMARRAPRWTFTFECVDQIALTPRGKVQYFIRHI